MDQEPRHFAAREDVVSRVEPSRAVRHHAAERRHSFRVTVPGRASIWRKNQLHGHYVLQDLCLEGCSLRGGPSCAQGEHVELVLHLPDCPPIWIGASVRRSSARASDSPCLALRFDRLPPRVEDRLQDLVVTMYTRMHAASGGFCLVIDPRAALREELVSSLAEVGERAVAVATPLDALQLLLERGEHVHTAFIGPQRSSASHVELMEFLARHHPRVRRVLLGDAHELSESWLAEATGEVHALLETPYSEEALRKVVHRVSALPDQALS